MAKNPVRHVGDDDEFVEETDEFANEGLEEADTSEGLEDEEVDLGTIETPKPLERGWQRLTIVSAVPGMSKGQPAKNGKAATPPARKIEIRVKVEGGRYDGRNIFDTLSFAPGALPYTKVALTGLGIDPRAKLRVSDIAEQLLHHTAEGFVDVQPASGEYEARNRIRRWRAVKDDVESLEERLED